MKIEQLLHYQKSFLDHFKSMGKSENSLKCYRLDFNCLNDFVKNHFKQVKQDVTFDHGITKNLEHYLGEKYPNINSVRRKLQTMRLFFDFLVEKKIVQINPIKQIQSSPKVLYPPTLHKMVEIESVQLYLIYKIKNSSSSKEVLQNFRNYILFLIIYHGGLSVTLLSNLKKEHFLNLNTDDDEFRILISDNKRREPYSIPIPSAFKKTFKTYFNLLNEEMIKDDYFFDQVFFNSNSYRLISAGISARGLEDIFHKMCETLKLEIAITPKSLRQTATLHWLAENTPVSTVKEWLGVAPAYNISLYLIVLENNIIECGKLKNLSDFEIILPTIK